MVCIRAQQERNWQEKYISMELILTLDAQQAERERDALKIALLQKDSHFTEADKVRISLESKLNELQSKYDDLLSVNICLEDKCVWGLELEQV